jgi:hypothetical protein
MPWRGPSKPPDVTAERPKDHVRTEQLVSVVHVRRLLDVSDRLQGADEPPVGTRQFPTYSSRRAMPTAAVLL